MPGPVQRWTPGGRRGDAEAPAETERDDRADPREAPEEARDIHWEDPDEGFLTGGLLTRHFSVTFKENMLHLQTHNFERPPLMKHP